MVPKDGRVATAITGADGAFSSVTTESPSDGALPGDYAVAVTPVSTYNENPTSADDYASPPPPPFPAKYLNERTSGLSVTVEPGMSPVPLDLTD
ncbi:hypothetical protein CA12_04800 [Alienimonas californiensis]|uniref:Uncharacterized protein n=2 Tax=Alienimonas californiensis TaxID=2527989 RepID=A0A517P4V0_9PLAN|nr:hypothetical protein CA12_04800 [Alienimonas californiensis]